MSDAWRNHYPLIASEISDSTWLECSCGWDSTSAKRDWVEHIEAASAKADRYEHPRLGVTDLREGWDPKLDPPIPQPDGAPRAVLVTEHDGMVLISEAGLAMALESLDTPFHDYRVVAAAILAYLRGLI